MSRKKMSRLTCPMTTLSSRLALLSERANVNAKAKAVTPGTCPAHENTAAVPARRGPVAGCLRFKEAGEVLSICGASILRKSDASSAVAASHISKLQTTHTCAAEVSEISVRGMVRIASNGGYR